MCSPASHPLRSLHGRLGFIGARCYGVCEPMATDPEMPGYAANRELILRDVLAIDRTVLANERTLLSYFRTLLALLAGGASLIHFVTAWWAVPIGVVLLVSGPVLFAVGWWRYRRVSRHLQKVRLPMGEP